MSRTILAPLLGAATLAPLLSVGCGSQNSFATVGYVDSGGAFTTEGSDGGTVPGLEASIEQNDVAVTFVTLNCAGACATVEAVGSGGYPPYTFAWENGSTDATRTVCATSSTNYSVRVTDTGTSGEFPRPAQTAQASLTAHVVACSDAGADGGSALLTGPCDSLARTFSATGLNPNGTWSYGWSSTVGSAFTLYPMFIAQELDAGPYSTDGFPYIAQWFDPSQGVVSETGSVPDIQYNPSSTTVYPGNGNLSGNSWMVAPGQVVMAPSNAATDVSVARWTAPTSGTYVVKATFASAATSGFTDTANLSVLHDGVALGAGNGSVTATNTAFTFATSVSVAAADTIDFVVAAGAGLTYHLVSVDAEVCTLAPSDGG